jgi:hypothetical protein
VAAVTSQVIPLLRQEAGWKGALVLAGQDRRQALVFTIWDSAETLTDSSSHARSVLGAGQRAGFGGVVSSVEQLEILLDERASG